MDPQCNYGVDAEENKNMKLCVGEIDHVCWLNFDMKLGVYSCKPRSQSNLIIWRGLRRLKLCHMT